MQYKSVIFICKISLNYDKLAIQGVFTTDIYFKSFISDVIL